MSSTETKSKELTRIYRRDGCVKPSVVVKEASSKKSPIHDDFEWNDAIAAHEHRLATARQIIRVVQIVPAEGKRPQQLVHVPVTIIEGPTAATNLREGVYKPVEVVASNEDEYLRALRELTAQFRAIEKTIIELKTAAGEKSPFLTTLTESLAVAKSTIRMMLKERSVA